MPIHSHHSSDNLEKQKNIPVLRFPEFDEVWAKNNLGQIYKFKVTNSFSRANLNYEQGLIKNIHYGDIHTQFATLFDIDKETVPYINSDIDTEKISKDNYCQIGDVIFADASEDYNDIGKCIEIVNLNNVKVLSGLHTLLARPEKSKMANGFAGYLMKTKNVKLQIQREAQGAKVLGISAGRLSQINLNFPSLPEQQKIASFFTAIDQKISQLKQKKTLLEQYKKGVMQKIFSQQLRFRPDNGQEFPKWEKKKGDTLFETVSNKNHNSDLPILAITQEYGAIPRDLIDYYITVSEQSIQSYKVVERGDFIISLRSFQGGIEYSEYRGICSPAYIILRAIQKIDNRYFKYYFKTDKYITDLNRKLEGIRDGKMISYKYFSEISIDVPSFSEQTKIANFLSAIDNKINHTHTQIEKAELWKKGLLQQMFV